VASIRRRRRAKKDVWLVDYRDASGARQRLTAPTKDAAENLLSEKIRERQHPGALSPDRDITLSEYKDRWLEMIESEVKPRTLASYTQLLDLHIVPAFGRVRLRELSRAMIKRLLLKKREAGLGKNSVRLIRATLSVMLSDAVDDGILLANPALNLGRRQRGRPDKLSAADRVRNIRPMSQAELGTFLAAAQEVTPLYAPLFPVLAHAGLRPGEAYALQWADIDFANRRIRVERAWSAGRVETPKTGGGRTVDMSEHVVRALRRLRAKRNERKLKNPSDDLPPWVFCTEAGTPLDESRVRKNFSAALKKARLGGFRVYDLRHTFASLLLSQGAPITYVAAQLGHSKPTTTLQWYAHWIATGQERFVDGLAGPKTPKTTARTTKRGHQLGTKSKSGAPGVSEAPDLIGGPSRTRTLDPLIKSQLLYQLS
jgi:integrase